MALGIGMLIRRIRIRRRSPKQKNRDIRSIVSMMTSRKMSNPRQWFTLIVSIRGQPLVI